MKDESRAKCVMLLSELCRTVEFCGEGKGPTVKGNWKVSQKLESRPPIAAERPCLCTPEARCVWGRSVTSRFDDKEICAHDHYTQVLSSTM